VIAFVGVVYVGHMAFNRIPQGPSLSRELSAEEFIDVRGQFWNILQTNSNVLVRQAALLEFGNTDEIENRAKNFTNVF
jgi:hypothetical protein